MKFKHEAFIELNETVIEEYYQEDYKSYQGYRILAIDGSMIQLPYGKVIRDKFGSMNHQEDWINCGWSMVLYDVLNEIIVDAKLHEYVKSERLYLIEHAKRLKDSGKTKKDIIIADRGFPSLAVFVELQRLGIDFIIRYNGEQFLKELKPLVKSSEDDVIIEVSLEGTLERRKNPELIKLIKEGANKKIILRAVKVKLANGEYEYLVSSILDRNQLQKEDFKQIYSLRWKEEEHIKLEKNTSELENFSGRTVESVLQDYYSKMLILNLHSIIVQEAEKELKKETIQKKETLKYETYKINRNVSYGIVHSHIIKLLNKENSDWGKAYDELIKKLKRHTIPQRKGRYFQRVKKWLLKFPPNRRRAV